MAQLLMPTIARSLRRAASRAKHQLFPRPEVAAWRHACRVASTVPRYTPGEITLDGHRIAYADLLTLCPQWHEIFVEQSMKFRAAGDEPRILDCGANVGLASLYFTTLYPRARITAYEADPIIAELCRRNLAANGAPNVRVQAVAVWTEAGTVTFQQEGADSGAIEGTSTGLSGSAVRVPSIRLRDVIADEERVDLLKLDIEGAEAAVLADCAGVLDRVSAMLIDLHELDPSTRRTPEIMTLLADAGFRTSLSAVNPLPWRQGSTTSPFPGDSATWASTLRAWRP